MSFPNTKITGILRGLVTQPQVNPDFPVEPQPVWS